MTTTIFKPPSLGPLIGHTTQDSVRIWIRGFETDSAHRTIGVGAIFDDAQKPIADSGQYFRLQRDFDRTGTIDFNNLEAGRT